MSHTFDIQGRPIPHGVTTGEMPGIIPRRSISERSPVYGAFERAKESAAQMIAGREALASRGVQSRLSAQGISGIPGIQTAVSTPHRARATEQLASVSARFDIAEQSALMKERRLEFAMKQWRDEKDEARKARWTAIIAQITATGIGFAIGGPPGAVAGAAVGSAVGGQPAGVSIDPFAFQTFA